MLLLDSKFSETTPHQAHWAQDEVGFQCQYQVQHTTIQCQAQHTSSHVTWISVVDNALEHRNITRQSKYIHWIFSFVDIIL